MHPLRYLRSHGAPSCIVSGVSWLVGLACPQRGDEQHTVGGRLAEVRDGEAGSVGAVALEGVACSKTTQVEREREHEREARRGTDAAGIRNTTGEGSTHRGPIQRRGPATGDPHRREDPAEDPPPEGRAT